MIKIFSRAGKSLLVLLCSFLAHDSVHGLNCNYLAQFQPRGEGQDCNSIFAERTCYFSQSRVRVSTSPNRCPNPSRTARSSASPVAPPHPPASPLDSASLLTCRFGNPSAAPAAGVRGSRLRRRVGRWGKLQLRGACRRQVQASSGAVSGGAAASVKLKFNLKV